MKTGASMTSNGAKQKICDNVLNKGRWWSKKNGSEEKLQKQQQSAVREEHDTVKQRTGRLCFTVPQHCSPGERGKTRAAYQGELLNHTGEKHTKAVSEGWKTRQDKL